MHTLSIGDCIRFGWETFKQRPWILIGGFLLAMIIAGLPRLLDLNRRWVLTGRSSPRRRPTYGAIVALVSIAVSILVGLGLTTFSLRAHDNIKGYRSPTCGIPDPSGPSSAHIS